MSGIAKQWYVLRAIGGKEKKAKENIELEVKNRGLQDLLGEVVVPVEKLYSQRNGKKVVKENVLYSGYVFVECALEGEMAAVLVNTPNVIGFLELQSVPVKRKVKDRDGNEVEKVVGEKKIPRPMRESEANRMIGRMDEQVDETMDVVVPYVVGDSVKVIDGPFSGFSGLVEVVDEEKKKLSVTVKIFGRNTPLELGYFQVEKDA